MLNKYHRKILTRAARGKCYGDFGEICTLADRGLLKIDNMTTDPTLESSELRIALTDAGREALTQR